MIPALTGTKYRLLVLICLLRHDNFEKHGLIDYNFQCFKEAVTEVFEFSQKRNSQQHDLTLKLAGSHSH